MKLEIDGVEETVVRKVSGGRIGAMTSWEGHYVKVVILTPEEEERIKKVEERKETGQNQTL